MNRNLNIPDVETIELPPDRPHKLQNTWLSHHRVKEAQCSHPKDEKKPKCAGLYRSHAQGDKAFELISLEDLNSVLDTGCVDDKLSSSYIGRRNSVVRRLSIDSRASTAWLIMNNPGLVDLAHDHDGAIDEEELSEAGSIDELHCKTKTSVALSTNGGLLGRHRATTDTMEHHQFNGHFVHDKTSVTIRKWRQHKQINDSPMRMFAQDEMHFQFLERLSEKIAVSVPMPLMVEICNEAMPIIAATVVAYEKTLGKSNSMTKEATARCKELQEKHNMYADI